LHRLADANNQPTKISLQSSGWGIRAEPGGSGKQAELGLEFREFFRPMTEACCRSHS
jgi:hypothetical protein